MDVSGGQREVCRYGRQSTADCPVARHWLVLVETEGFTAAADGDLVPRTVSRRSGHSVAHHGLSFAAAAHFDRGAVHRDLRTDGAGLGAEIVEGKFLSVFFVHFLRPVRDPGAVRDASVAANGGADCRSHYPLDSHGCHPAGNAIERSERAFSI